MSPPKYKRVAAIVRDHITDGTLVTQTAVSRPAAGSEPYIDRLATAIAAATPYAERTGLTGKSARLQAPEGWTDQELAVEHRRDQQRLLKLRPLPAAHPHLGAHPPLLPQLRSPCTTEVEMDR